MKTIFTTLIMGLSLATLSVANTAEIPQESLIHASPSSFNLLNTNSRNDVLNSSSGFQTCHNQCVFDFVICQRQPYANPFDCSKAYNGCYAECVNQHL